MTEGYSCSDLAAVCREAAMGPLRQLNPKALVQAQAADLRNITFTDFKEAMQQLGRGQNTSKHMSWLRKVRPSVSKEVINEFHRWNRAYGSS